MKEERQADRDKLKLVEWRGEEKEINKQVTKKFLNDRATLNLIG